MSQNDDILNEDVLLPFEELSKNFKEIKKCNGSFQAIRFITSQMNKIDGVESLELEEGRLQSLVYFNPETKTALLHIMARKEQKGRYLISTMKRKKTVQCSETKFN